MAFVLADRVQETATANTTVSFTLSGAVSGYQSFSAIGNGNTTYYSATDGTNWEVGYGTYTSSGTTLSRDTILSSSNSGSAVTFSGTVIVFVDYPSSKQISSDYPNALGVVTPAAGTFTTITGQTEVLKGTGSNLLLQSNTFNTTWATQSASVTGSQSDPFGGSTAWTLLADGTLNSHGVSQSISFTSGISYTYSVYLKKNTNNYAQLRYSSAVGGGYANFDLNAGTVGTTGAGSGNTPTSTIQSIGSGWYRCSMTVAVNATASATPNIYVVSSSSASPAESVTLSTSIYIYAAQVEIGSVANTYIPTTTTAVYGTPTLSFSGVAGLGLQSDGSLYVSPAGTGALQAQATTSSTVGGNARGANAVDWQTIRNNANQVASSSYTVLAGGQYNKVDGYGSTVTGGQANSATGTYTFVGNGLSNTVNSGGFGNLYSGIVTGYSNSISGVFNFIGGGYSNSGTASAAVTTQSGTMNATTAVTLSGSNANIKVGQIISGTSINSFPPTYVAAISGTSLTLSQNASGSSTSTLSFYTPHGVVVGGGNNQATGSYSFIGGGGDAGTAANRNVASGDWSFVGGGRNNTASGSGSFVGGGGTDGTSNNLANLASGIGASIVGGALNVASGNFSFVGGRNNTADGNRSTAFGLFATTRGIAGNVAISPCNVPISANLGISQTALLVLARQTTDATATVLTSDTSAASGTNQVILPNNSAYYFTGEVISGVTGGGDSKGWTISGVIKRGANAGATTLVGSTVTSLYADAGAATWTIGLTADTTNGGLKVTFTGQASTTIRVVAQLRTTEMTF